MMIEESELSEYETTLNDLSRRHSHNELLQVVVESGTSAQDVWTSTCDAREDALKARARNRARSKSRSRSNERTFERPRSLEDLLAKRRERLGLGVKQRSSGSLNVKSEHIIRHRKGNSEDLVLVPSKSSRSLDDPLSERKARGGGLGEKKGSSKSMDGGSKDRRHRSSRSRSKSRSRDDQSQEDPISSKRRGRRGMGDRQEYPSPKDVRAHSRSRSKGRSRSRDRSAEDPLKKESKPLDGVGSKHRSRHTKSGKDEMNGRSTHSHSGHDELNSRSPHSQTRNDELNARSTHSTTSAGARYQRSKSHDREREVVETKRRERRRARSKSPGPGVDAVDSKRSPRSKSKERRGTRASRPGVERSSSHRSFGDAKERRHDGRSRSRSADPGAMAASTSSHRDRGKEKARRQGDSRGRSPEGMQIHTRKISHGSSEPEGVALHAEAVDGDMNVKMIQKQVQEALDKMTQGNKPTADLDVTAPNDSHSDSDSDSEASTRCMSGQRMCILVLMLIIFGVVGGFAAYRAARPPKAADTDAPSSAPTGTQVAQVPTGSRPIDQPPSEDDCLAIQNQKPIAGQDDLDVVSFDIQMEVLVDDEGNYAGTMANIILVIEQDIIPGLTGCTQALQRRLEESVRFLRRSRQLEGTRSYPIANAKVSGNYEDGEPCLMNVTSTNGTQSCRTLTLTVETFAKEGADNSEIILLIEDAFNSERLEEKLDLPGNTTLGQVEVFRDTNAPTSSSMPSSATMAPTSTPSPSTIGSENPTGAPMGGPMKEDSTRSPTKSPSPAPSLSPTMSDRSQTKSPSPAPSLSPTMSEIPSPSPTMALSLSPTKVPKPDATPLPTITPSRAPSNSPTTAPSPVPTAKPSAHPSHSPTESPSTGPTKSPTASPSASPSTRSPTMAPTTTMTQRNALMALYNGANGSFASSSAGWQSTGDECAWSYVSCDGDGNVASLIISDTGLSGTISHHIGALTALTFLAMGDNVNIAGTIPTAIGRLMDLEFLGLDGNMLSGRIPAEIVNLTSLRILALHGNQLTGAVPQLRASGTFDVCLVSDNRLSDTTFADNVGCTTSFQSP